MRTGAESTVHRGVRQNSGISEELDSDEPLEPSKEYHRAITSLYAGTDPEASRLNGKVRVFRPPELPLIYRLTRTRKIPFQYLTAWARRTLPSKKALDSQLRTRLWDWCEEQVKKDTKVDKDVKAKEDTKVEEDSKPEVEGDITVEEIPKIAEVTKAEKDTKPKVDIKVEEGTKADEATKAKEGTKADEATKAKEDTEAKEDTKSKE
jgi:hypothetical protein